MSKNISEPVSTTYQSQKFDAMSFPDFPANKANGVPYTTDPIAAVGSTGWVSAISGGTIAFITSIAAQWLIYDYWLGGKGLRLADPSIAAIAVGLFIRHLGYIAHQRRLADLRRFAVIGEMNHHIRNALQVLAYEPFLPDRSSEMAQQAIKRIEWVLTEVLPAVRDEGIDGEK